MAEAEQKCEDFKILFVSQTPQPPNTNKSLNRAYHLSKILNGEVISGCWYSQDHQLYDQIKSSLGSMKFNSIQWKGSNFFLKLSYLFDILYHVFKSIKKNNIEVVEVYGPYFLALAVLGFKIFLKFKLVVFVPGHPVKGRLIHPKRQTMISLFRNFISFKVAKFVCSHSDGLITLYPKQLECFGISDKKTKVFKEFVPVNFLENEVTEVEEDNYILLVGYPFYIKGADVLIRAFNLIEKNNQEIKLKIYGFHDQLDKQDLIQQVSCPSKVSIENAVPFNKCLSLIANARVLVLPSRTEAMGRVMIEAMALKTPVVASNVDGIPHYLEDKKTGLLFESENEGQLASTVETILEDNKLASKLTKNAYDRVMSEFNEDNYIKDYKNIICEVLGI